MPKEGQSSTNRLMRRLVGRYVRPYFGRLFIAVILMAISAACTGALAKLMEPVLDEIFVSQDKSQLYFIATLIFGVFVIKGVSTYGQGVMLEWVGQRVIADLQKQMFCHLMQADLSYFTSQSTGSLISRFTNDVGLLKNSVSSVLTGMGKDSLTLVALVGVMFYQDWALASVAFFVFPLAIYPVVRLGKRMRKFSTGTQEYMGIFTSHLDQTFQDMRTIKAFQLEGRKANFAIDLIERVFKLTFKATRVRNASRPLMEILGGVAIVIVIFYGGLQVIEGVRSTGSFFSFITALLLAYEPMKKLAALNTNLQEGMSAATRVFHLLDHHHKIDNDSEAVDLEIKKGEIVFDDVSFGYLPDGGRDKPEIWALNHVSLKVPAGKTIALVGPSGAGKTTILNLIPRFYDVHSGSVKIDGQDVRKVTIESLRDSITLVSQEVGLFDLTVRENIAFGKPGASEDEIIKAAKAAAADEFIRALPQGYETIVGERGVMLSGGQRQRIAIARALLKDAPILLFDEATSALDTENERLIKQAISRLTKGRTTIMIAHRLSTIMQADLIYVIVGGRVVEQGTHSELVKNDGVYARLYHLQFDDESKAA